MVLDQFYTPEFHVSDPFERTNFDRSSEGLVVGGHPLQRSLRNDHFIRLCDLAQVCGDINVLAKNITAVGGFDKKNAAVM
jgi:hypothetical protein